MTQDDGRVPAAPGSREPSPSVSAASGFDPSRGAPRLGGGISPVQWLRSIATADRKIRANARAAEGEAIADYIETLEAERNAFRTQSINRGWNWRMCDAYGRAEYQRNMEREVDATLDVMLGRKTFDETLRDSDRSGEAGETVKQGSTVGESAGRSDSEGIAHD